MQTLSYWIVLGFINFLQALPLTWVARIGRYGGALAHYIDGRHRKVAQANLAAAFGKEKSAAEIASLARENFRRLGENYASAIKTAAMTQEKLAHHLTLVGEEKILRCKAASKSRVLAIGHFGNFELYARSNSTLRDYKFATTYRGLNHPKLDLLLTKLRAKSGCLFFERRTDSGRLKDAMAHKAIILGLLSDQHAGQGGAWVPFFGRVCSTNTSAAIFAQRYKLPLFTAICFRTALAQWRVEVGDEIPTLDADGQRRSTEEIMADVNRAFEVAVRRDPANWFWVHNRWKPKKDRSGKRKMQQAAEDTLAKT